MLIDGLIETVLPNDHKGQVQIMKKKLSVTIEEKMISKIEESMGDNTYRNKSHLVEVALEHFFKRKKNNERNN